MLYKYLRFIDTTTDNRLWCRKKHDLQTMTNAIKIHFKVQIQLLQSMHFVSLEQNEWDLQQNREHSSHLNRVDFRHNLQCAGLEVAVLTVGISGTKLQTARIQVLLFELTLCCWARKSIIGLAICRVKWRRKSDRLPWYPFFSITTYALYAATSRRL